MSFREKMKKVGSGIYSGAKKSASRVSKTVKTKVDEQVVEYKRKKAIENEAYKQEEAKYITKKANNQDAELRAKGREKARAKYAPKPATNNNNQQGSGMMLGGGSMMKGNQGSGMVLGGGPAMGNSGKNKKRRNPFDI